MAIVAKVLTPDFFSKDEPYKFVFFVEELKPIYRSGACTNPRYMQVYDLRLIYPEASDVYEAKTLFMEEITNGLYRAGLRVAGGDLCAQRRSNDRGGSREPALCGSPG